MESFHQRTLSLSVVVGLVTSTVLADGQAEERSMHWAFQPIVGHETPEVSQTGWATDPLDFFILKKLESRSLAPAPEADPAVWLRRVSFDLTGLPPAPEVLNGFLKDPSEAAREAVVDTLLDSPRYGERAAQHWLDVVRYADTHGFEVNTERPNAWPYRDWVIAAFNRDLPWDQFVTRQIAGDGEGAPEATGFLVTAAALLPGQIGQDEASKRLARQDELSEVVANVGEAFLGLTVGCARCHDHKFDPITAKDYYAMQAYFAGIGYGDRPRSGSADSQEIDRLKATLAEKERALIAASALATSGETRPMIGARANLDRWKPLATKKLRFTIHETVNDNLREPVIDELEVFTAQGENIAPQAFSVEASGSLESDRHQLAFLNDQRYGNGRSWMADEKGRGWVTLTWEQTESISHAIWGRDREGAFADRLATQYTVELMGPNGNWVQVADHTSRLPIGSEQHDRQLFEPEDFDPSLGPRVASWRASRDSLDRALTPKTVFAAVPRPPETTHILRRGDPERPGEEVHPSPPGFLARASAAPVLGDLGRRQSLARWITAPENPLTTRVIVNRVWQWSFGTGLVSTPNDFGLQGEAPSHPELLDHLATWFLNNGQSIKALRRRIVLSATYRQSSQISERGMAADADSRLVWRFPSRRHDAETLRDTMLAVSGRLNPEMGGPGFNLFGSRGGLNGFPPIDTFEEPGRRRLIYAHKVRMERAPVFGAFDCPDAGQSAPQRGRSTTPIQALNLFNSPFTMAEAEALARRLENEAGSGLDTQIQRAWWLVFGRAPTQTEWEDATSVALAHGLETVCRALFNSNEFVHLP